MLKVTYVNVSPSSRSGACIFSSISLLLSRHGYSFFFFICGVLPMAFASNTRLLCLPPTYAYTHDLLLSLLPYFMSLSFVFGFCVFLRAAHAQMLEPFAAEIRVNILSARGSLVSANMGVMLEDFDARFSYTDMILLQVGVAFPRPSPLFVFAASFSRRPCFFRIFFCPPLFLRWSSLPLPSPSPLLLPHPLPLRPV